VTALKKLMVPKKKIVDLCKRWQIREFSFFGSIVGDSFTEASDVDVLIRFDRSTHLGLFEIEAIREELEALLGRPVDIVEMDAVKNPYRRAAILASHEVLYAA